MCIRDSWLGTDNLGRDVFSRIMDGLGTSFLIAISVVIIGCVMGILIGSLCGYYGGVADAILTRVCDTITAFPAMLPVSYTHLDVYKRQVLYRGSICRALAVATT